jgi:hypothetical protein
MVLACWRVSPALMVSGMFVWTAQLPLMPIPVKRAGQQTPASADNSVEAAKTRQSDTPPANAPDSQSTS